MRTTVVSLMLVALVGCGDSSRRGGGTDGAVASDGSAGSDASPSDDGGASGDDAGPPADAGPPVSCNGTVCDSGQLCCQVSCAGAMGCTAPEVDGRCPLLGCPPPPAGTPCGDQTCDSATEICVAGNFGGPGTIDCQPVPEGCESDRSCTCVAETYCSIGLAMCSQVAANHIFCETGLD